MREMGEMDVVVYEFLHAIHVLSARVYVKHVWGILLVFRACDR